MRPGYEMKNIYSERRTSNEVRTEIMGNDHDTTFKIFDGKSQGINRTHIQMVCGFVCRAALASNFCRNDSATYLAEVRVGAP